MATKQLIETNIWKDKWFLALSPDKQRLFLYLVTGPDTNPAGLFELDRILIVHGLRIKNYKKLLKEMTPKVKYDSDNDIVWIVKYYFKNSRGPKMKKAVENALNKYQKSDLVHEFCDFYKTESFHIDNIEYTYPIDTLSIEVKDKDKDKEQEKEKNADNLKAHEEIIKYLNKKLKKRYRLTTDGTTDLIDARIKEGFTVEDFKSVIDIKYDAWIYDDKMCRNLRPKTLFSGEYFEGYLNEVIKPEKKIDPVEELFIKVAEGT